MNLKMKGRIDYTEFHEGNHYVCVTTPAVDAYSQPNSFKLASVSSLGSVGTEVDVVVELSGYVKKKPYQDKITHENKVFRDGVVYLRVVQKVS
jgi:hypothetical protein